MTTSGSTDFALTRANLIKYAMLEIGALASGESPTTDETTDVSFMLNAMCKHWQQYHGIYRMKDVTVTLTAGTESYTIGTGLTIDTAKPVSVIAARRRDSNSIDVPIAVYSRDEYMSISDKDIQAPANGVYYERLLTSGKLYVWPTGSTGNTTVIITIQRPIEDFDATGDEADLPQEWFFALIKNLAVHIAPMFRLAVPSDTLREAKLALEELKNFQYEPVPIRFQPRYGN